MDANEKYLQALDDSLAKHLADDLRKQRVAEIRSHLTMAQAESEQIGLDMTSASRAARRALGSPQVLARQMVRQARGYDSATAWRLTLACGIALVLATGIPVLLLRDVAFQPWAGLALRWLPFFVLVYFGGLVARTQRWLAWSMAGWAALATIGMFAVGSIPFPLATPANPTVVRSLESALKTVKQEEAVAESWRLGRAPIDKAPVAQRSGLAHRYYPLIPIEFGSRSIVQYALTSATPGESARLWAANGAAYAANVQERMTTVEAILRQMNHSSGFAGGSMAATAKYFIVDTVEQTTVFAGVNWLVLALSSAALRRKTRRDPLLA